MLGGKAVAAVFRRECGAVVECQPERSRVRLDQDVGNGDLVLQVRPLARMMRIFVVADIEPRPPIARDFPHAGDVVGDKVVAESVALVSRTISVGSCWMNSKPDAIADAGGKD